VAKDVMDFRRMEIRKDRNSDGSRCRDGKIGDSPVRAILADDRDPVSLRDSLVLQKCPKAVNLVLEFGVRDRFVVRVRKSRMLRVGLGAPFEHRLYCPVFKLRQFLYP
jgi:hypothetical protein